MNRIISFLLKSLIAFLIVLFQLPVFATDYYSVNDGLFSELSIWSTSPTIVTRPPLSIDFTDPANNFTIRNGDQVTISLNSSISLNDLTIVGATKGAMSASSLKFSTGVKFPIKINGNLSISNGSLDFGTASVSITVAGDLIGGLNSKIIQSPVSAATQRITLNGAENAIESYITNSGGGKSEVSYASDSEQQIFGASTNAYSTLSISGRGKKVLAGNIIVSTGLNLTSTYIQLDGSNLLYAGTEANLNATTGWVYVNGKGIYKNINTTETTKTFPVGNATSLQKVTLSDISPSSTQIDMLFKDNGGSALTSGMGSWYFSASVATTFNATFYPTGTSTITASSSIASSNSTTSWKVKSTSFTSATNSYSSVDPFVLSNGYRWFMLYNCPVYTIAPASIPVSYVGDAFNDLQFSVNSSNNTATNINNLLIDQTLKDFNLVSGVLRCTNTPPKPQAQTTSFILTYTDPTGCSVQESYTIKVITLPSPNLSILPIDAKTFDSDSFRVRTYSRSTGTITYSISPATGCASINVNTGFVKINSCTTPAPNNQYTVTATQASDGRTYKAESVSKSFIINPAPGRLYIKNFAFLVNSPDAPINTVTKSIGGAITFDQLSGFNEATVSGAGIVDPLQTGQFTVRISLSATNNYTAFDSVYTFNVYTLDKPPIAVGDTITLEMGKDSTFNILLNDRGQTSEIIPKNTDIDIENRGQQLRYYATELGNFLIDTLGNLTVRPFYGFIGSGRLGYTVTDLNGLSSSIAYVEVIIIPPYVVPELKVNTIMTPNGDNLNDALVIANTDLSKENSLIIIDQVGNTVYETSNYQNNWEGIDAKDNKLEPGVYFYTFKEKASGRELNNYIQIVK